MRESICVDLHLVDAGGDGGDFDGEAVVEVVVAEGIGEVGAGDVGVGA